MLWVWKDGGLESGGAQVDAVFGGPCCSQPRARHRPEHLRSSLCAMLLRAGAPSFSDHLHQRNWSCLTWGGMPVISEPEPMNDWNWGKKWLLPFLKVDLVVQHSVSPRASIIQAQARLQAPVRTASFLLPTQLLSTLLFINHCYKNTNTRSAFRES